METAFMVIDGALIIGALANGLWAIGIADKERYAEAAYRMAFSAFLAATVAA